MRNEHHCRDGFSLIAIALILAVLGALIIVSLLPQSANQFDKVAQTQNKLDKIRLAITTYAAQNGGAYPCPAGLTTPTTSASFGQPVFIPGGSPSPTTMCRQFGCNNANINYVGGGGPPGDFYCPAITSNGTGLTWVGAVPVRNLGLADDYEFDQWGNRFTYVVNNFSTFIVKDINGNSTGVYFFAFSAGPDGMGSYLRNGSPNPKNCVQNSLDAHLSEYENCDFAVPITGDDTFLFRAWNIDNASSTYFDDITFKF